ncbi:MAG: SMI1/KNR4 family protein [Armatimonadetes bacterium]|nr:SMI1/KNR4 family protein [Armatimonadota bacterium]
MAPPATEAELGEAERALGFPLPPDAVWRRHDGSGEVLSYGCFCGLQEAIEERDSHLEYYEGWNPHWLPIAVNGGGDCSYLDLDENSPVFGQVVGFVHDDICDPIDSAEGTFAAWLERWVAELERGDSYYDADSHRFRRSGEWLFADAPDR